MDKYFTSYFTQSLKVAPVDGVLPTIPIENPPPWDTDQQVFLPEAMRLIIPWYDADRYYVPEHDPRWCMKNVKDFKSEFDAQIMVLGNRKYFVEPGVEKIAHYGKFKFSYLVDLEGRSLYVEGKCVYCLGEPKKDVNIKGFTLPVYYHGPQKRVWVDGFQFVLNIDAPPERIQIAGCDYFMQIDGFTNEVIVNGSAVCSLADTVPRVFDVSGRSHEIRCVAPPKEILIDNKLCVLNYSGKYPFVEISGENHGICFDGEFCDDQREMIINRRSYCIPLSRPRRIRIGGPWIHVVGFGGPGHEVIIDNQMYEVKFGGPPKVFRMGIMSIEIQLPGDPPDVKILGEIRSHDEIQRIAGPMPPENFTYIQVEPKFLNNIFPTGRGPGKADIRSFGARARLPPPPRFDMPGGPMGIRPRPPGPPGFGRPPRPILPPPPRPLEPRLPVSNGPAGPFIPGPDGMMPGPGVMMPGPDGMPVVTGPDGMPVGPGAPMPVMPMPAENPVQPIVVQPDIDVGNLFSKLLQAGIINKEGSGSRSSTPTLPGLETQPETSQPAAAPEVEPAPEPPVVEEEKREEIPDISDFDLDSLKKKYKGILQDLYRGVQCPACGLRFISEDTKMYKDHLDWHFRLNRREKDEVKVSTFRRWYYDLTDWIEYSEISDLEDKQSAVFEEMLAQQQEGGKRKRRPSLHPSCPVTTGDDDESCCICRESFEQYWDEEQDEWRLRDAVRVDEKLYHPVCYEDVKGDEMPDSSLLQTPTPQVEKAETKIQLPDPITNPLEYLVALNKLNQQKAVGEASSSPPLKARIPILDNDSTYSSSENEDNDDNTSPSESGTPGVNEGEMTAEEAMVIIRGKIEVPVKTEENSNSSGSAEVDKLVEEAIVRNVSSMKEEPMETQPDDGSLSPGHQDTVEQDAKTDEEVLKAAPGDQNADECDSKEVHEEQSAVVEEQKSAEAETEDEKTVEEEQKPVDIEQNAVEKQTVEDPQKVVEEEEKVVPEKQVKNAIGSEVQAEVSRMKALIGNVQYQSKRLVIKAGKVGGGKTKSPLASPTVENAKSVESSQVLRTSINTAADSQSAVSEIAAAENKNVAPETPVTPQVSDKTPPMNINITPSSSEQTPSAIKGECPLEVTPRMGTPGVDSDNEEVTSRTSSQYQEDYDTEQEIIRCNLKMEGNVDSEASSREISPVGLKRTAVRPPAALNDAHFSATPVQIENSDSRLSAPPIGLENRICVPSTGEADDAYSSDRSGTPLMDEVGEYSDDEADDVDSQSSEIIKENLRDDEGLETLGSGDRDYRSKHNADQANS